MLRLLGTNAGAVSPVRVAGAGRALRYAGGSAPARRPTPTTVTFLNGRDADISIRWTHHWHPACWAALEDAFAWKEERTLSRSLTLQYHKILFILEPTDQAKAAIGERVTVVDYPDGRLAIRYRGVELAYRTVAGAQRPMQVLTCSLAAWRSARCSRQ